MPTLLPPDPRRGSAICTLLSIASLWLGADVATAQSFLRRSGGSSPPAAGAAAAPATTVPTRSAGARAATASRPTTAPASAATSRGGVPPAAPAKRAGATPPAVVRADGATAQAAADGGGVVQAGRIVTADCRHCGRRGCNACRPGGGRIALECNGRCDAGGCPAHCPVRPEHFGYYPTQWRSWPGQGVRQVAHFDPATTPVVPPRSQLPTMEEEGGSPPEEDAAADGPADAAEAPPMRPARPAVDAAAPPARPGGDAPDDMPAPVPAARAPVDEADGPPPEADPDATMPEESGAASRAPAADETVAASRGAAVRDAAGVLLSPRRAAPARPASAWRSTAAPRERRIDIDEAADAGPSEDDGAAAPAALMEPSVVAAPGNPLRPAEQRAGIDTADRRQRAGATEGWRPARRGFPGDAAETTLRGVTANPGNPLR